MALSRREVRADLGRVASRFPCTACVYEAHYLHIFVADELPLVQGDHRWTEASMLYYSTSNRKIMDREAFDLDLVCIQSKIHFATIRNGLLGLFAR